MHSVFACVCIFICISSGKCFELSLLLSWLLLIFCNDLQGTSCSMRCRVPGRRCLRPPWSGPQRWSRRYWRCRQATWMRTCSVHLLMVSHMLTEGPVPRLRWHIFAA